MSFSDHIKSTKGLYPFNNLKCQLQLNQVTQTDKGSGQWTTLPVKVAKHVTLNWGDLCLGFQGKGSLILLHSERPKLYAIVYTILAFLSAIGLSHIQEFSLVTSDKQHAEGMVIDKKKQKNWIPFWTLMK